MAIFDLNNKFYKVNLLRVNVATGSPFRVYFSAEEIDRLKKFLETKQGKKLANRPLRKIVKEIIDRYIEEHSE